MDRRETQRRWAGMMASTVVVLSLAAGCSSGGSAERVDTGRGMQGPASADGTEGASPSTTDAPSSTSTAAPTAKPASAEGCEELAMLVLEPAVEPTEQPARPSDAEAEAAVRRLVPLLPEDLREDFGALVSPATADDDQLVGVDVAGLLVDVIAWGAARCPQPVPVWACSARSSFTPVGNAIGVDGETTGATGGAAYDSPEEAAGDPEPGDGERTVLAEEDDLTTFGWLDDAGLVTRRLEVARTDEGWQPGQDTVCRGDESGATADDDFEIIGEAIDDPAPKPPSEMTPEELDDLCLGDQAMTDHDWEYCLEHGYEY